MASLSESILYRLNRWIPNPTRALAEAKLDPVKYVDFLGQRVESSFSQFGPLDWEGKDLLELGCGLGANLAFLYRKTSRSIMAVDIDSAQLACAKSVLEEMHPELSASMKYMAADAVNIPLKAGSVDIIVAADVFEHVNQLRATLVECNRLLRSGGKLYATFPPYFSPWGAHMVNWIKLPWCQLFFSETILLKVARRMELDGTAVNVQLPLRTRLNLGEGTKIPFINHLTLRHFLKTLAAVPTLRVKRIRFLPLGWRSASWISYILRLPTHIPIVREAFTSRVILIVEKI